MSEPKVIIHRTDVNSFGYLTVIAQEDPMTVGVVTATVLFHGYPVAMVSLDGADDHSDYWMSPLSDDVMEHNPRNQQAHAYAGFLLDIGSLDDESFIQEWTDGRMSFDDLVDHCDDGHAWVAFLGEVATAIHAAYPDITPEPTGF